MEECGLVRNTAAGQSLILRAAGITLTYRETEESCDDVSVTAMTLSVFVFLLSIALIMILQMLMSRCPGN
jgi:hypothetical protein